MLSLTGNFGQWARSDISWDPIIKMEVVPREEYVYDLCVANSEVFAVDQGLLVHNTALTNIAEVNPGDKVKPGDVLASSNFTDHKGKYAIGTNLRVGYYAADGRLFEDSTVISESAAKKLTSQHTYNESVDVDDSLNMDKSKFAQLFPGKFTKEQLDKLTDKGMVKPGQLLKPGDPVFVGLRQTPPGPGNMGRGNVRQFVITWDHDHDGTVSDAIKTKNGFKTYISTSEPATYGDKISNAFAAKGVIGKVIPDDQMPRDSEGRPLEVLLSPMGIASRTNSALLSAAMLGKVAAKTGKPYSVGGFSPDNLAEFANKELTKNNIPMTEDVFDPTKGVHVPGIFTGNLYVYKMQQTAESKTKGRSTDNYSQEDIPEGKHFGDMEWAALLGSHATETIKDLKLIKGRRNDDFWRQTKLGETPTMPGTPIVYDKFKSMLQAAGINIAEDRNHSHIFAMTNKQAEALTQGNKLENANTFSATNFKPLTGGLFDPDKTSSLADGKKWAYYELPEPLPNPIMEEPIRSLLGVTRKEFAGVVSGDIPLQGKTGGTAIKDYLSRLSLTDVISKAEEQIKNGSASKRDAAIKLATYAKAMQREGVRPEDFMMTRVPVLPPSYRPISAMGSMTMVADPNYMYKALVDTMTDYKESKDLPKELQNKARGEMYQAYRALVGTQDPNQEKLQEKKIGGMLDQILGKGSPKASMWQRRVLGANIDLYGLSAISLNPALKLNQVGVPENQAWEIYSPFLVKELIRQGNDATSAVRDIKNHSENAYRVLQKVMAERPVIINRAPTLHKYSIGAAWPILVKGNTLQVPPSRNKAFNYDLDGDTMSYSVPVSDKAVHEAVSKLMPESGLLSIANDQPMYVPSQEYNMGGYLMSKEPAQEKSQSFRSWKDAVQAYKQGKIKVDTPVRIV